METGLGENDPSVGFTTPVPQSMAHPVDNCFFYRCRDLETITTKCSGAERSW